VKLPSLEVKTELIELSEFDLTDQKLTKFEELLKTEGITRGLIGPKEADRIRQRHILNCLPITKLIPVSPKLKVADLGSGAGLPGLVVGITRPDLDLTLIEPLQRRAQFLLEAVNELNLKTKVIAKNSKLVSEKFDVIMARAVAPLGKLLLLAKPLLRENGRLLALVGQGIFDQVSELFQQSDSDQKRNAQNFNLTLYKIKLEGETGEIDKTEELAPILILEAVLKRGDQPK